MSRDLNFNPDDEQVTVSMIKGFSDLVVTEVNLIGCTVAVKQSIQDAMGTKLIASLKGDLDVQDDTALTGRFTYQEFMPDGTTQRCASYLDVSYTLMNGGSLGAAAQHVLATP